MRKSELLKHVPAGMPDNTESMMKLFKACGKDVIMVCGWPAPLYTFSSQKGFAVHFTWDAGYLTYYPDTKAWTRESADMAGFSTVSLIGEPVRKFAERNGDKNCRDIDRFKRNLRWRKQEAAEQKVQKRVDGIINTYVPPLPRGFRQKVTAMAKEVKPGRKIYVKLFQNTHDAVVERMFTVTKRNPKDWKDENYVKAHPVEIMEICDAFTSDYGNPWESWYYGQCYNTVGRKQSFWPNKRGMIGNLPTRYLVYDNFAEEDFTWQQESCLRIMSGLVDPAVLLNKLYFNPDLEQLIKSGMTRMAADLCNDYYTQDKIEKLKRMDRQTINSLRENNAGWMAAEIMTENPKLDRKWIGTISEIRSEFKAGYIRTISNKGLNMNHVFTLLSKTGGIKENILSLYVDYLRMAEARGSNIHDEIIYRNKRWRQFHDAYVEEGLRRQQEERDRWNREEAAKLDAEYREKYGNIQRDYQRNEKIFSRETETCLFVVPKSYRDIVEEGQKQHHCVGSCGGIYMQRMSDRVSWIVFLRHHENPEEPWYTIETDGNRVIQFYAAYDRQPDKEEVQKLLTEWMKQVRKNKKKVEKQEEEERKAQKLKEAAEAAGQDAAQPLLMPA